MLGADRFKALPLPARYVASVMGAALTMGVVLNGVFALKSYMTYASVVDDAVPRIQRLKGYIESERTLREANQDATRQLSQWAYVSEVDAGQVGAQLQQELRAYAEAASLTVTGSQVIQDQTSTVDDRLIELTVELKITGQPDGLERFLDALRAHRPILSIVELSVTQQRLTLARRRAQQSAGGPELLAISMRVVALKVPL